MRRSTTIRRSPAIAYGLRTTNTAKLRILAILSFAFVEWYECADGFPARSRTIRHYSLRCLRPTLIPTQKSVVVTLEPVDGEPLEQCPKCKNGVLRLKPGKHGAFHGCNRFPACDYTRAATDPEAAAFRTGMELSNRISGHVKVGDSCPVCKQGVLQQRKGQLGPFIGCSRYRAGCMATSNISDV